LTAQFNQEISLEANGCELNVGEGNLISADSKVVIKGTDESEKFVVKDNLGNNIFQVATNGDSVFIGGNQNSGAKLSIFDPFFNLIFLVDTNNNSLVMGNSAVTASEIYLKPTNGLIDLVGSGNAILQSTIRASHNTNPTGGSVQMSAFRDNTDYNKIESTGAQGLLIKADTDLRLESDYGATMTAIGCSIIGENGFVNLLAQEPVGGINTNLRLQNDGILILTEDLGPPQNQMQFTYNSIISKGNPNTNTASINFQPNANTISMSDTSMNNISINNSPTLAQHGTRKDYVDGKFNNTTLTGSANVPTGSSLSIVDAPTLSTHATNKQYVDTKFTSPRTILSALTYVNELAGGGTLPSTPTTTNTTTFSEFNFTGATLITSVNGFTLVSAGVFQYTGADTRVFNFNIDIGVVTAVADQLVQVVLLNGSNVVIQPTLSQFYTSTTDKNGGSSVNLTLSLSTNDIVKVGIRTPRQTTSLTIENYKLQIIEN
jgi:hypothetical protein